MAEAKASVFGSKKKNVVHLGAYNSKNTTLLQQYQSPIVISNLKDLVNADIPLFVKYTTEYFERAKDLLSKTLGVVTSRNSVKVVLESKFGENQRENESRKRKNIAMRNDLKELFAYHRKFLLEMYPIHSMIHDTSDMTGTSESMLVFECMCYNLLIQREIDDYDENDEDSVIHSVDYDVTDVDFQRIAEAGMATVGKDVPICQYNQRQLQQAWKQLAWKCEQLDFEDKDLLQDYMDYRMQLLYCTAERCLTVYDSDNLEAQIIFNAGRAYINKFNVKQDDTTTQEKMEVSVRYIMEIMTKYIMTEFRIYYYFEIFPKRLLSQEDTMKARSTIIKRFTEKCGFAFSGDLQDKRRKREMLLDFMTKRLRDIMYEMGSSLNVSSLQHEIVDRAAECFTPIGYKIEARFRNDLIPLPTNKEQRQMFYTTPQNYYLTSEWQKKRITYFIDEEVHRTTPSVVFRTTCLLLDQQFLINKTKLPWSKECVVADRDLWMFFLPCPQTEDFVPMGNARVNDAMSYIPEEHHYFEKSSLKDVPQPQRVMGSSDATSTVGTGSDFVEQFVDENGNLKYRRPLKYLGSQAWMNDAENGETSTRSKKYLQRQQKKQEYWRKMMENGLYKKPATGVRKFWLVPFDLRSRREDQNPMVVKYGKTIYTTVITPGPLYKLMPNKYTAEPGTTVLSTCEAYLLWNLSIMLESGFSYHRIRGKTMDLGFMQVFLRQLIKQGLMKYCFADTSTDPNWEADKEDMRRLYNKIQHHHSINDIDDGLDFYDLSIDTLFADNDLEEEEKQKLQEYYEQTIQDSFVTMDEVPSISSV